MEYEAFVITIMDLEKSVKAAERCIKSASMFNMKVEKFAALTGDAAARARAQHDHVQRGHLGVRGGGPVGTRAEPPRRDAEARPRR